MGGNIRHRLKNQKGKRWKKGHSSSSNPESNKFRDAAKNRFFQKGAGSGGLTVEALAKHDAKEGDHEDSSMLDAQSEGRGSAGGRTMSTWASNWTDCTNVTFGRVHRYWSSSSALHKEILAVLAAVTEVIKSQGGSETETEYFAALMTTLETVDDESSVAAVAYLLSLVIKRVPTVVLKSRFSDISRALLSVMATHADTDTPALLRSVIVCLAQVLRVQEQAIWANSSTLAFYDGLLSFIIHSKPKTRKAAHAAIRAILRGSTFMTQEGAPLYHPAANHTAKYCVQLIEQSGGKSDSTCTLHTLTLLKEVLAVFPQVALKSTCETILKLLTLSSIMVTSVSMQAFHGMFSVRPSEKSLPADLNARIITALYDYQPGEGDPQPTAAWLTVMEKAHINLSSLNKALCVSHLPRLFSVCLKCLRTEKTPVMLAASKTLTVLIKECVAPAVKSSNAGPTDPSLQKMFHTLESGLGYQYHASWGLALQVMAVFFEMLDESYYPLVKKCVISMADLRGSHGFPYKRDLDAALGMAIRTLGPRLILDAVPLQITGNDDDYDFPRSWLLPVLRSNIRETELAFFSSYFLPLAARLRTKATTYAGEKKTVQSKTYDSLQLQIWSLLPGFCNKPSDIKQAFKGLAKILGTAISDRQDLRMEVMLSLRKLITHCLDDDEDRAEVSRFAKNFLPLLFNVFSSEATNEKSPMRLAVLETVKSYLQIADRDLIGSFFDRCLGRTEEEDATAFTRHALIDLVIAMIPYVSENRVTAAATQIMKQLKSDDRTQQKKSYRVLEEICAGRSPECKSFVTSSLEELQDQLLESLSKSNPSSKAPRLRCLIHIFRQLGDSQIDFLAAVIPEAVLCTKEAADRARKAAFVLLVEMGRALLRWADIDDPKAVVQEYFELLLAGLAGTPHMVSCTLLAVTTVLYQFKDNVSEAVLGTLVDSTCLLLKSKAREIVQSALALLKALICIFPDTMLAQFMHKMVSCIVAMKEESKHHLRFKSKEIFTRLVRKFGFDVISGLVPASHAKVLTNIRKTQERVKRKKQQREEGGQEDGDEEEDMFVSKQQPESINDILRDTDSELEEDESAAASRGKKKEKKGRKTGAAWLREGKEEDIVDFLDPSVSKKVLATKPKSEADTEAMKGGSQRGFQMAPDGRLIIREDKDEDEGHHKGKSSTNDEDDAFDDLDEVLSAMGISAKKRQRKRRMSNDDESMMDEAVPPMKYQAGGSGIHRPVDSGSKPKRGKNLAPGEEFKAKKARGDMKRAGKPDPYAYVPLEFKSLNRRKSAKAAGKFHNLVRGAQRGSAKGQKLRNKKKMK